MMKKYLLAATLLSLLTISLSAQDQWVIKLKDGTSKEFNVDDIEEMYPESDDDTDDDTDTDTHEAVDLGLSVKWATCNIGADSPEEYGDYFAWGETNGYDAGKTTFSWNTYKWLVSMGRSTKITKYCTSVTYGTVDNRTTLEASDDAATANWSSKWRMPTYAEFEELKDKCTWIKAATNNGPNGYIVRGPNGNSIFLPAAGYRDDDSLVDAGTDGYYWTSELVSDTPTCAYFFEFGLMGNNYRYFGRTIRPVTE